MGGCSRGRRSAKPLVRQGVPHLYSRDPRHMMSRAVLSATVTRARSALLDNSSSGMARPVALAQVNLTNVKLFLSVIILAPTPRGRLAGTR